MSAMKYWFNDEFDTIEKVSERISDAIDAVFSDLRKYHTAAAVNSKLGLTTRDEIIATKADWFNDFAVLTPRMVHRGLKKSCSQDWCPTLAQFVTACKPTAESSFFEAQAGIKDRSNGLLGKWSCPAVYWAAMDFGASEIVNSTWAFQGKRWAKFFGDKMDMQEAGRLDDVPAAVKTDNLLNYVPRSERSEFLTKKVEDLAKKPSAQSNDASWAWRCKSLTAAKLIADHMNSTFRGVLSEAAESHLLTKKLACSNGVWSVGTYWGAA